MVIVIYKVATSDHVLFHVGYSEVPVLPSPPATLVPLTLSKEQPVSAYKNGATDLSFTKALPSVPGINKHFRLL